MRISDWSSDVYSSDLEVPTSGDLHIFRPGAAIDGRSGADIPHLAEAVVAGFEPAAAQSSPPRLPPIRTATTASSAGDERFQRLPRRRAASAEAVSCLPSFRDRPFLRPYWPYPARKSVRSVKRVSVRV